MSLNYQQFFGSFSAPDLRTLIDGQRSIDGSGNNSANPSWGSTNEALIRLTNSYPDHRGDNEAKINQALFANAEALTETVMNGDKIDINNEDNLNEYLQFFGQFLAHDIVGSTGGGDGAIRFTDDTGTPVGFSLSRNLGDTQNQLEDPDGLAGVRDQFNNETAYLDLGQVYDNIQQTSDLLWDADTGRMIEGKNGLLPTRQEIIDQADPGESTTHIFDGNPRGQFAGDARALQTEQLASHHTIWLKNHNHHVDQLLQSKVANEWSGEEIYNAARALNEAEFQWVVYNEYLPGVIGDNNFSPYQGYNASINADIINEFATLAFRFGHDQANNSFNLLEEDGRVPLGGEHISLQDSFIPLSGPEAGQTKSTTLGEQADWIRGQLGIATQEIDGFVASGNRGGLFGIPGLNLVAFDILRQHDHGVADYDAVRESFGLQTYDTWTSYFADSILANDILRQAQLKSVYGADEGDVSNLDALLGILLEEKVQGSQSENSQLGETGTRLVAMQFENIRAGDAFYFENYMSDKQAAEIKNVSLAEILGRNSDISYVYRDAFISANRLSIAANTTDEAGDDEDLIVGSQNSEVLSGEGSNDDIYGGGGNDTLNGNHGDDWIWGGSGSDFINGQSGNDLLYGEQGNDIIDGGNGDDTIRGGVGGDSLYGGNGDDFIFGDAGNDRIDGGNGNDTISGGEGSDTISYTSGHDVITDFNYREGDRVILENWVNFSDLNGLQWNRLVANGIVSIIDADNNAVENDLVINFDSRNSLTLLETGDNIFMA